MDDIYISMVVNQLDASTRIGVSLPQALKPATLEVLNILTNMEKSSCLFKFLLLQWPVRILRIYSRIYSSLLLTLKNPFILH